MKKNKYFILLIICSLFSLKFNLPPGFHYETLTEDLPKARSLTYDEKNNRLFVGNAQRDSSYIHSLDLKEDFSIERKQTLGPFRVPNGVTYHNNTLYISEITHIWKVEDIHEKLSRYHSKAIPTSEMIALVKDLPNNPYHARRYLRLSPKGTLFFSIGAPCNVCLKKDKRFSSILEITNMNSGKYRIYAHGVRNSVGFDFHPKTKELWFTDNGRDMLGDDIPPDELNEASKSGLHFGFPYHHGKQVKDPLYASQKPPNLLFETPTYSLSPHGAALGMRFYTGNQFPEEYHNAIFIVQRGSWNRTKKIGYNVLVIKPSSQKVESFLEGFVDHKTQRVFGRPVDIEILKDGSLVLSDDRNGTLYRIYYTGK